MSKTFYNPELTAILNTLLSKIPAHGSFDLFDISKQQGAIYDDLFTDMFSKTEPTYALISNELIAQGLCTLTVGQKIALTDNGRKLKENGSWEAYIGLLKLEAKSKRSELWSKAYWYKSESIKTILIVVITMIFTLLGEWLIQKFTSI